MGLLILVNIYKPKLDEDGFTFHYGSINTELKKSVERLVKKFTFHYGSINTRNTLLYTIYL